MTLTLTPKSTSMGLFPPFTPGAAAVPGFGTTLSISAAGTNALTATARTTNPLS